MRDVPDKGTKKIGEVKPMNAKNQCIHCTVDSCKHHGIENKCELTEIDVAPKKDCVSGRCDESQCASYKARW